MQEELTESELEYVFENMTMSQFNQLDELSKETLVRYVKGAGVDKSRAEKERGELDKANSMLKDVTYSRHLEKLDPDASKGVRDRAQATSSALHKASLKADDTIWKRKEGIHTALKKLTK